MKTQFITIFLPVFLVNQLKKLVLLMTIMVFINLNLFAQNETSLLLKAIEEYPDSLELHQNYLKAFRKLPDSNLDQQYKVWMEKFPKSATIPYALGEAYYKKELPEANPLLLKAVELDPSLAKVYYYLFIDSDRWGDFEKSKEYILKAKQLEPSNPDYAFYYASSFKSVNPKKYRDLSLEVSRQFSQSERGAQSLYWLANNANNAIEKKEYYEILKNNFPPEKFSWSSSGMPEYFALLIKEFSVEDAQLLAQNMLNVFKNERDRKDWRVLLTVAQNVNMAENYLGENNPNEALAALNNTVLPRWPNLKDYMLLLKTKALDKSGKTELAYNELKIAFAKSPEKMINDALKTYGRKLGKNDMDIENDVLIVHDSTCEPATDFTLKNYLTPGSTTLSNLKGKVILITYWFPGCGPCRGEFPHFQSVVDKFKGEEDFVYLGINITPNQNDYVVPFIKQSGYSFIPLEDYPDRIKGNLDNGGGAPTNFLIDRKGNVVFSHFRTDANNMEVLEEMISSLLKRK